MIRSRQPSLHVLTQRVIADQLAGLGSASSRLGLVVGEAGSIRNLAGIDRAVAAQFLTDRRRRSSQLLGDLTSTDLLGVQDRDLLALNE
jgi:hypothetical protein